MNQTILMRKDAVSSHNYFSSLLPGTSTILLIMLVFFATTGCFGPQGKPANTPTSGSLSIGVDNTYEPIIKEELTIFSLDYPDGHIAPIFKPENDVLSLLLKDSVRFVILGRKLNAMELKPFDAKKIEVHQTMIARDAIALIVNPENNDTSFSKSEVFKLFSGGYQKWEEHKKGGMKADINIVLDNSASSTGRFIKEFAGEKALSSKQVYALKTNPEVINYVSTHRNALGIIGVNWISNTNDSTANSFSKKIRVLAIAPDAGEKGAGAYYKPFQAYIAEGQYCLSRNMYAISAEGYSGLGTGFAVFLNGDKGQRIILKSGLVPANGVVRVVEFK